VLTRVAIALVDLCVTVLAREPGHTLADVVALAVDARAAVVTIHRGTAVNQVLAPRPLVTWKRTSKL